MRQAVIAIVVGVFGAGVILPAQQTTTPQQQPPPPRTQPDNRPLLGRPSPPQPQQKQGLDYFAGTWTYSWTGRESAITAGPRTGTVTFTKSSTPSTLDIAAEGTSEASGAFKETGTFTWTEEKKSATIREHLAAGVDVSGQGDWTSPIAIRYESEPIRFKGQTLKLKRLYSIHSVASFSVSEELSTDGGPFVRLGNGTFSKKQ